MTCKDALLIALIGLLCVLILPAYSCDCSFFAYNALNRIHVKLRTFPAVTVNEGMASYRHGVVSVPPNSPCMVYVHEFIHHDQWEHGLEALQQGDAVWTQLERNAAILTRDAMEHQSTCTND